MLCGHRTSPTGVTVNFGSDPNLAAGCLLNPPCKPALLTLHTCLINGSVKLPWGVLHVFYSDSGFPEGSGVKVEGQSASAAAGFAKPFPGPRSSEEQAPAEQQQQQQQQHHCYHQEEQQQNIFVQQRHHFHQQQQQGQHWDQRQDLEQDMCQQQEQQQVLEYDMEVENSFRSMDQMEEDGGYPVDQEQQEVGGQDSAGVVLEAGAAGKEDDLGANENQELRPLMFAPSFMGAGERVPGAWQQREGRWQQEGNLGQVGWQQQEQEEENAEGWQQQGQWQQQQELAGAYGSTDMELRCCVVMGVLGVLCWELAEYMWYELLGGWLDCQHDRWECPGGLSQEELYQQLTSLGFNEVHWIVLKFARKFQREVLWMEEYHGDKGLKVLGALETFELKPAVLLCTQYWLCAFLHNQLCGEQQGFVQPCHWQQWLGRVDAVLVEQLQKVCTEAGEEKWTEWEKAWAGVQDGEGELVREAVKKAREAREEQFKAAINVAIGAEVPLMLDPGEHGYCSTEKAKALCRRFYSASHRQCTRHSTVQAK